MERKIEDELFGMENTLTAVKTANATVRLCNETWASKKQLSKEHFWTINGRLESLRKQLDELDRSIKILPIKFSQASIDERINYNSSLMAIPKKYEKIIRDCDNGMRCIRHDDGQMYFADLMLLLAGMNDRAIGIEKTIELIQGHKTAEDLRKEAVEDVKMADYHVSSGIALPDKRGSTIANLTWSYFHIMTPVTEADGNDIYDITAVGHPYSWKSCWNKVHNRSNSRSLLRYVNNVHSNAINPDNWQDKLCYPEMLNLLAASDVMLMKLRQGLAPGKPNAQTYIS